MPHGVNFVFKPELPTFGITFSNNHLLNLERQGRFPRRRYLGRGTRTPCWLRHELEKWAASRPTILEAAVSPRGVEVDHANF